MNSACHNSVAGKHFELEKEMKNLLKMITDDHNLGFMFTEKKVKSPLPVKEDTLFVILTDLENYNVTGTSLAFAQCTRDESKWQVILRVGGPEYAGRYPTTEVLNELQGPVENIGNNVATVVINAARVTEKDLRSLFARMRTAHDARSLVAG